MATYYHPMFANTPEEVSERKVVVGSYVHCRPAPTTLLFDLPESLVVFIGDATIESEVFDYLNPLFMNESIATSLRFFDMKQGKFVDSFTCSQVILPDLDQILPLFSEKNIRYRNNIIINYKGMMVMQLTGTGVTFAELYNSLARATVIILPQTLEEDDEFEDEFSSSEAD